MRLSQHTISFMYCQILMANMSQTRTLQVFRFCIGSLQVSEIILKQFGVHNSSWGYYPKESSKRGLIMSSFCSLWYLSIRYVDKLWVTIRSCYMCWIRCLHFRWFSNSLQYVLSDHHGRPPTPTGAQSWCRWPVLDNQVIEYNVTGSWLIHCCIITWKCSLLPKCNLTG